MSSRFFGPTRTLSLALDSPHKSYRSLDDANAHHALSAHYDFANGVYKLWASPASVISAIALGWTRSQHPAQLHYGWDLEHQPSLDAAIRATTHQVFSALEVNERVDSCVLEPGCGIGGAVTQLAQRAQNVEFVGVSMVWRQQQIALSRARRMALNNTHFVHANYLRLPIADACFDGIYAIEALCYTPPQQRHQMLRELRRVLKPGACLSVLDGYTVRAPQTEFERIAQQDVLDGWTLPPPTHPQQFSDVAREVGLELVRATDVTQHIYASAQRIHAIGRWALRPLCRLSGLPGGTTLLAPIGFGSSIGARRFAAACVSQLTLFDLGIGQYWHHVFRRIA